MAGISEILRFSSPRSLTFKVAFTKLRNKVATNGPASFQYFGYTNQNEGFPVPKPENEICWFIQWPENCSFRDSSDFRTELAEISGGDVRSLFVKFKETRPGELIKGLEAAACQFAIINLVAKAPRFKNDFEQSMHKTFTDCYHQKGFTGGGWNYILNSNDADGEINVASLGEKVLDNEEQRLAYYCLGWESIEVHHIAAKTPLFDEEIDKLKPYFGRGTGAFYVGFEKHSSNST